MRHKPKTIYLEVMVKQIYGFEEGMINGWSIERVIDSWFKEFDININHATRDGHHYGNIDTVVNVKEVNPSDFEPRIDEYFKQISDYRKLHRPEVLKMPGGWEELAGAINKED